MTKISTEKNGMAAFGAGCFWGVEEAFRKIPGVINTIVGYMGGTLPNPTYEDVCSGTTGHVETVLVTYDPQRVTYDKLLETFWENHDPTTLNRQGPDHGSEYRSVIFFYAPEQEKEARESKEKLEKSVKFKNPVVTEIVPASIFYKAEEYHQRFLEKRGLKVCHP